MASLFGGSSTRSSSRSFVDPAQQPFLDFLRNTGMGLVGQNTGAQGFAQQQGGQLYGQLAGNLGQLTQNPFLSGLQQQAQGNPALVQQQTQALAGTTSSGPVLAASLATSALGAVPGRPWRNRWGPRGCPRSSHRGPQDSPQRTHSVPSRQV